MFRPKGIPLILAVGAGLLLAAQAVYAPVPGPSASALAGYAGLQPFRPLTTPIWGALVQALSLLPGVPLALAASLCQVLIGVAAIFLLAQIFVELPYRELINDPSRGVKDDAAPRAVSATAAVLFFVSTSVFQAAFALPHPDVIGLPLLLAAWLAFQRFHMRSDLKALYACSALLSLGAVESASVALAAPFFAVYAFVILGVRRQFTPRVVVMSIACALVGVVVLLVAVTLYFKSPVAEWREVARWRDAFDLFRREYMAAGPRAIPRQGWLVIFLLALLPIPFVFSRGFQERQEGGAEFGLSLFRFALLPAISMLVLFDLPGAPMRIAPSENPLLTPYAAVALWFGRLVGLAFAWVRYPPLRRGAVRAADEPLRPLSIALLAVLLIVTGFASWQNRPVAQRQTARALARIADDALAAAPRGGWIVTDGALDSAMQIRARDRGVEARALNLGALGNLAYQRFLHAVHGFADPAWIGALGFESALADRLAREIREGRPPVGIFHYDAPLPEGWRWRAISLIVRASDEVEPDQRRMEEALGAIQAFSTLPSIKWPLSMGLARQRDWIARVAARWSNEIGVELFARGAYADARKAFEQALAFQPDHVAALINLRECRLAAGETPDEESLARIRKEWSRLPPGAAARTVRARFGRVVSPDAARAESAEWAAYGFAERALTAADAGGLNPAEATIRMLRARVLADEGDFERAADEVIASAEENPDALPQRLALIRLKSAEGRAEEARELLEGLRGRLSEADLNLEFARLWLAEGRIEEALTLLRARLKQDPLHPEAALLQAQALAESGRETEWRDALAVLERATGRSLRGLLYLAELAIRNGDRAAAVRYLERAHAVQPGARAPLEALLELDLTRADPAPIEGRARALLAIDPLHPRAWYAIGVSMARRGKWDLAAQAFEKSNNAKPDFRALNDWAWALHQAGRSSEALEKAGEACAMRPEDSFLWATRGKIAFDAKRYDQAAESFERAIALGRPSAQILAALHQSYLGLNDAASAERVRAELDARAAMLTESESRALRASP